MRFRIVSLSVTAGIIPVALGALRTFLTEQGVPINNETLTRIINNERVSGKDELFFLIGNDEIALSEQLLKGIKPQSQGLFNKILRNPFGGKNRTEAEGTTSPAEAIDTKKVYVLTSTDGGTSNYTLGDCCHPIPGDDVVGYVNENNEVVVHKLDCPTAMLLKSSYGSRLVQTRWDTKSQKFLASIHVEGIDRMGILQEIIYLISTNMAINMRRLNISADEGLFKCDLDVLIEDTHVVTNLCKRIKKVPGVNTASRIN